MRGPRSCNRTRYFDLHPLQEIAVSPWLDRQPQPVLDVSEAQMIHKLSERRQRLRATPWHLWQRDHEAREKNLSRLLEEEYAAKRRALVERGNRVR